MRKLRVIHYGIAHDHSVFAMQMLRRYPDVFEIVGVCEPDETARRSFTALLYFLKGTVLLYGGQEYSCSRLPSLFDKEVFPRTGKDITPLLQKLNAVRRAHLSAGDWFTAEADDANDIAVCLRDDGKKKKLGVFSLKGKSAEVNVPMKDGDYVNFITGEAVTVQGGKMRCTGEPVIIAE